MQSVRFLPVPRDSVSLMGMMGIDGPGTILGSAAAMLNPDRADLNLEAAVFENDAMGSSPTVCLSPNSSGKADILNGSLPLDSFRAVRGCQATEAVGQRTKSLRDSPLKRPA